MAVAVGLGDLQYISQLEALNPSSREFSAIVAEVDASVRWCIIHVGSRCIIHVGSRQVLYDKCRHQSGVI